MAKANFNDWNYMGNSLDSSGQPNNKPVNTSVCSFVFLFSVVLLVLFGAVAVYSASAGIPETEEITPESFLFRQIVYIGAGAVVFLAVSLLPVSVIKFISPFTVLGALAFNIYSIVTNPLYTQNELSVLMIFISTTLYFSSYFSNRNNTVEGLSDLIAPIFVAVAFTAILSLSADFLIVALYILAVVAVFGFCTVSFASCILLFMFVLVPALCIVFSDADKINTLLDFIVPGLSDGGISEKIQLRRQCISSGSLAGKGLAMGHFKLAGLQGIESENILCNICEETGLIGLGLLVVLYSVFAVSAYRVGTIVKGNDLFKSNITDCLTTLIVFQVLVNMATVLGYFPENSISLPFISSGPQVILLMFECGCIYRCSLRNIKKSRSNEVHTPVAEVSEEVEK